MVIRRWRVIEGDTLPCHVITPLQAEIRPLEAELLPALAVAA
jgi:hypothetical protein